LTRSRSGWFGTRAARRDHPRRLRRRGFGGTNRRWRLRNLSGNLRNGSFLHRVHYRGLRFRLHLRFGCRFCNRGNRLGFNYRRRHLSDRRLGGRLGLWCHIGCLRYRRSKGSGGLGLHRFRNGCRRSSSSLIRRCVRGLWCHVIRRWLLGGLLGRSLLFGWSLLDRLGLFRLLIAG
jgi:hypothetical protein